MIGTENPHGLSIAPGFLFPNGQAVFDRVNNVSARLEGRVPMHGGRAHPDGYVADGTTSRPVHAGNPRYCKPVVGFP